MNETNIENKKQPQTPPTVCVAGASGLVGSNIVKACLEKGWHVRGTMRNANDPGKVPYLTALPDAKERLQLFTADMAMTDAFDEVTEGVDCVFIACLIPTYYGLNGKPARKMNDEQGYAEIIMPTVDGCLNILRSANRHSVKNVIICSSTSSTNPVPSPLVKNEVDHWSDEAEQCLAKKYTSATKTVMEKAAFRFAGENHIRMSIFLPSMILGPVLMPGHMNERILKLIGGEPMHEQIPNNSMSMIDVRDLAALFLAAYENPQACGRYFGVYTSWHWVDIYRAFKEILPNMKIPHPPDGELVAPTGFDNSRRDSLGVPVRDIPTILRETIEWTKTEPFGEKIYHV